MTRAQAQSKQIERTRRTLVIQYGDEAMSKIDTDINRCIASGVEAMALLEWRFSPYHKDGQVFAYGKMQIHKHFKEAA